MILLYYILLFNFTMLTIGVTIIHSVFIRTLTLIIRIHKSPMFYEKRYCKNDKFAASDLFQRVMIPCIIFSFDNTNHLGTEETSWCSL